MENNGTHALEENTHSLLHMYRQTEMNPDDDAARGQTLMEKLTGGDP